MQGEFIDGSDKLIGAFGLHSAAERHKRELNQPGLLPYEIQSANDVIESRGRLATTTRALAVADRGYVLHPGKVAHHGDAGVLLTDENVKCLF